MAVRAFLLRHPWLASAFVGFAVLLLGSVTAAVSGLMEPNVEGQVVVANAALGAACFVGVRFVIGMVMWLNMRYPSTAADSGRRRRWLPLTLALLLYSLAAMMFWTIRLHSDSIRTPQPVGPEATLLVIAVVALVAGLGLGTVAIKRTGRAEWFRSWLPGSSWL